MKKLFTLLILLFSSLCYGQGNVPLGTSKDTVTVKGTLALPLLPNTGSKLLSTDDKGKVVLVNGGSAASGIQYEPAFTSASNVFTVLGDSWSDSDYDPGTYAKKVFDSLSGYSFNGRAVQGTGMIKALSQAFLYTERWKRKSITMAMIGLNDYRRGQSTPALNELMSRGTEALLINCFLDTAYASNNAIMTKYGTWSTYAFAANNITPTKSESISGLAVFTTAVGDSVIYQFTGNNVALGYFKHLSYGNLQISIDGVVIDTLIPSLLAISGTLDGWAGYPAAKVYTCGTGAHKLKIRCISGASNAWAFDYIGHLQSPGNVAPVLIGDIAYNADNTLDPNSSYGYYTRDRVNDGNYAIRRAIETRFDSYLGKIRAFHPNAVLSLNTDYLSDGVHLTNAGHIKLAAEVVRVIKRFAGDDKRYYPGAGQAITRITATSTDYTDVTVTSANGPTPDIKVDLSAGAKDLIIRNYKTNLLTNQGGNLWTNYMRCGILSADTVKLLNALVSTNSSDSLLVRSIDGFIKTYAPISGFATNSAVAALLAAQQTALNTKVPIDTTLGTLTYGTTVTWNIANAIYQDKKITLTGNVTTFNISSPTTTGIYTLFPTFGGNSIAGWDSKITWLAGAAPDNTVKIISFKYDGTTLWGAYK